MRPRSCLGRYHEPYEIAEYRSLADKIVVLVAEERLESPTQAASATTANENDDDAAPSTSPPICTLGYATALSRGNRAFALRGGRSNRPCEEPQKQTPNIHWRRR